MTIPDGNPSQPKRTRNNVKRSAKVAATVPAAPKPKPTERDLAVGREARERVRARRKRPQVVGDPGQPGVAQSPHSDTATFAATYLDTFGTTSDDFAERATKQLSSAMYWEGIGPVESLNAGLAIVAGVQPENEIEAMLAIQMAATHEAALSMLRIIRSEATETAVTGTARTHSFLGSTLRGPEEKA
jgi:hypothetical protein